MFGRFEALRDALPGFHVDYRERMSDDPAVRWTDRVVPDGTWESNLFQFYVRVMQRLSGDLRIPFQLDSELYRKDDTTVHEALREAVVNALVHADHRGQGGVVMERYPDRIELSNPGSLLVSREQLLKGGVSECRNKSLQLMFQLMGGGDKAGSGMDKIRAGWRAQHWRSPRLEESLQPDRVKLALPMVSLIPDAVDQALRLRFGDRFGALDTTAVQAVVTAQVEGSVTNARMQEITGEHSKDITGVLQTLVRDGLLTQQNQRRWASYRVAGSSPHLGEDSRHLAGESPQLGENSRHLAEDSRHLNPELLSLAEPARLKAKLPTSEMQTLVLSLCDSRWLTTRDLADLLSRDPENLQRRILTGLVKQGLLELRHPGVPNRPDQAYRSVVKREP
jgi:ATP-dependent DNA helicase RecG